MMKTKYWGALLLALNLSMTACSSSDDDDKTTIAVATLPTTATAQLDSIVNMAGTASTPGVRTTLATAHQYAKPNAQGVLYEVLLNANGVRVEVEFDAVGHWRSVESDTDNRGIPHVVLHALQGFPASILTYINHFYPRQEVIEDIDRLWPSGEIRLELLEDQVIRFDASGQLLSSTLEAQQGVIGHVPAPQVTAEVTAFINTYFAGSSVIYAKTEQVDGKTAQVYYLSTGHKVSFVDGSWYELEGDDERFLALPEPTSNLWPEATRTYLLAGKHTVYEAKRVPMGGYELTLARGVEVVFNAMGEVVRIDR